MGLSERSDTEAGQPNLGNPILRAMQAGPWSSQGTSVVVPAIDGGRGGGPFRVPCGRVPVPTTLKAPSHPSTFARWRCARPMAHVRTGSGTVGGRSTPTCGFPALSARAGARSPCTRDPDRAGRRAAGRVQACGPRPPDRRVCGAAVPAPASEREHGDPTLLIRQRLARFSQFASRCNRVAKARWGLLGPNIAISRRRSVMSRAPTHSDFASPN